MGILENNWKMWAVIVACSIIAAAMTPLIRTVTNDICLDFLLFSNNGEDFDASSPFEASLSWFTHSVLLPLLAFSFSFFLSLISFLALLSFISRTQ